MTSHSIQTSAGHISAMEQKLCYMASIVTKI